MAAPEEFGLDSQTLCRIVEWLDGDRQLNVHSVLVVRRIHVSAKQPTLPTASGMRRSRQYKTMRFNSFTAAARMMRVVSGSGTVDPTIGVLRESRILPDNRDLRGKDKEKLFALAGIRKRLAGKIEDARKIPEPE